MRRSLGWNCSRDWPRPIPPPSAPPRRRRSRAGQRLAGTVPARQSQWPGAHAANQGHRASRRHTCPGRRRRGGGCEPAPKIGRRNVMIVDVLRNDFGRVCRPGSISVPPSGRPRRCRPCAPGFGGAGRARPGSLAANLLEACWPGGSITGAPKIRASEIIDELESRSVAAPIAAAYLPWASTRADRQPGDPHGATPTGVGHLHVGAGIVAESDADLEYAETCHKARGVLQALGALAD